MTLPPKSLPKPRSLPDQAGACLRIDCAACEVRHLTFCAALGEDEIGEVASIVSQRHLDANEMLFQEGDPVEDVYNLLEGVLKLYKLLPDGRRQITGFLYPGDFLGLGSAHGYSCAAEAVSACRLCRFSRPRLEALVRKHPGIEHRLLGYAGDELAAAQDQMLLLGRKTAGEKVASFLLRTAQKWSRHGPSGEPVFLPMSRADIADYLGLTVETVSRTLTRLKSEGVIALPAPRAIEICDPAALRRLSDG